MSFALRPYQQKAIAELFQAIRDGYKRPLWVIPTGGGKSTVASAVVKKCNAAGKRTLFMVHSKELVQQFASRLRNQFRINSGTIMSGVKADRGQLNQVASVQTLVRRDKPDADIIFIDEAHRAKAKTYRKILEYYPDAIVVGLTATPFRADGKGLYDIFDTIVHPVKIKSLVDMGHLVPTKVYIPAESVDMTGTKIIAGDYDKKELGTRFGDYSIVSGVVTNYQKFAAGKKAIVFSVNVDLSQQVCEKFKAAGISAAHLDGNTSKEERAQVVRDFANGRYTVLSNCALFREGFDIPDTECVILNLATKSLGMYVQCIGRGLRPANGKDHCIVIDHGNNTIEHGFVEDYDRSPFGLQGLPKKKGKQIKTKKCKECAAVVDRFARECPRCGAEFQKIERSVKMGEAGEFIAVDRDAITVAHLEKLDWKKKAVKPCHLRIMAALKGYKYGWVIRYAIEKGYISVPSEHPQFYQILNKELTMAEIAAGTRELSQEICKYRKLIAA